MVEYIEIPVICPICHYEYTLRLITMYEIERCPLCARTFSLNTWRIKNLEELIQVVSK